MAIYASETFRLKDGREVVLRSAEPEDAPAFVEFQRTIAEETTHTMQEVGRKIDLPPPWVQNRRRTGERRSHPRPIRKRVFHRKASLVLLPF
jgi:hypothetical protein